MSWKFVDDKPTEATAFAEQFARADPGLKVEFISPGDAREQLIDKAANPAGVLIDVDLSAIAGERGSGPGIAQDIRVGQKAGRVPEFPLVRFAGRVQVRRNIGNDPASDDLFDLKIQKEAASSNLSSVSLMLVGVEEIYRSLSEMMLASDDEVFQLLRLSPENFANWGHRAFVGRMRAARSAGVHVAAGALMRSFILPDGLLIPEDLVAARLGVSVQSDGWPSLLRELMPYRYAGVGGDQFCRWWARGIEEWWFQISGGNQALMSVPIDGRIELLTRVFNVPLQPFAMNRLSPGERPWARCALHFEKDPSEFVAVDPAVAVRFRLIQDAPAWIDPTYAALGAAIRSEREDGRIDFVSMDAAKRKVGVK